MLSAYNFCSSLVLCLLSFLSFSTRLGSLVVESQAVIDSATDPAAPSDLTLALVDLDESQLTIGNQTGDVGLSVSGTVCEWNIFFLLRKRKNGKDLLLLLLKKREMGKIFINFFVEKERNGII